MKRPTEQQFTMHFEAMYIAKFGSSVPIHNLIKLRQLRESYTETITLLQEAGQYYNIPISIGKTTDYLTKGNFLIRDYYQLMILEADYRKDRRIRKWKLGFIAVMAVTAIYFISRGQGVFSFAAAFLGMETARQLYKGSNYTV